MLAQDISERRTDILLPTLDSDRLKQAAQAIGRPLIQVDVLRGRTLGERELHFEPLKLGGENRCAPDNRALGSGGVIRTPKIRYVPGNHVLAPPHPGRTAVHAGQERAAIGNATTLSILRLI